MSGSVEVAMSSAILLLITLTLSSVRPIFSPSLAAAAAADDDDNDNGGGGGNGIDDDEGNSTTILADSSARILTSEDAGVAVTVWNWTRNRSTVSSAENVTATWTTQPGEVPDTQSDNYA